MPIRYFRKWVPNAEVVRNHKYLAWFSQHLHDPNLWHFSRRSVPGAFSVGLFAAFIPLPFQMILAAAMAIPCRVNLPISVGLVWLTNPITMPPIFYAQYHLGAWMLSTPPTANIDFNFSWDWMTSELSTLWQPFLMGTLLFAIGGALIGNVAVRLAWRMHVWHYLSRRRLRKNTK